MTFWKNLVVALVAAFVLAACSSSDNDSVGMPTEPPEENGLTEAEAEALEKRATDAEAEVDRLREEQEKMQMQANAQSAGAVFKALNPAEDGFVSSAISVVNEFDATLYDSDELEKAMLERKSPTLGYEYDGYADDNQRANLERLLRTKDYDNNASGRQSPVMSAPDDAGYYLIDGMEADGFEGMYEALIASSSFKKSGNTPFKIMREGQAQRVPGTFDGASGTYVCTGPVGTTCTATKLAGDGYSLGGIDATWEFQLSSNDVMTVEPDTKYLVWGWWTVTDKEGGVTFGAFVHPEGLALIPTLPTSLAGKATYNGKALGQYALYDPLPGQVKESGAFMANATLNATFGGDSPNLSGLLDGFMTPRGEKDWTVKLREASITSLASDDNRTIWEIDGDEALAGGTWKAQFYDDNLGDVPGDTPSDVAGTFSAQYEETARMAGAFAAEHDTK